MWANFDQCWAEFETKCRCRPLLGRMCQDLAGFGTTWTSIVQLRRNLGRMLTSVDQPVAEIWNSRAREQNRSRRMARHRARLGSARLSDRGCRHVTLAPDVPWRTQCVRCGRRSRRLRSAAVRAAGCVCGPPWSRGRHAESRGCSGHAPSQPSCLALH